MIWRDEARPFYFTSSLPNSNFPTSAAASFVHLSADCRHKTVHAQEFSHWTWSVWRIVQMWRDFRSTFVCTKYWNSVTLRILCCRPYFCSWTFVKWPNGRFGFGNLTGNLHHITRNDLPGLDSLNALPVRPVNFPHLRLVLLQGLNGTFRIALLLNTGQNRKHWFQCWYHDLPEHTNWRWDMSGCQVSMNLSMQRNIVTLKETWIVRSEEVINPKATYLIVRVQTGGENCLNSK